MNRISEVIEEKKISVTQLSKLIGKSRVITSGYCNNVRQPSLETLRTIADCLDIDIRQLIMPSKEEFQTPIYIKPKDGNFKVIGGLTIPNKQNQ